VTREQVVNLVVALLVPVVTAVLGVLGVVFGDWRLRRTQAGRRKLALEDASRQVSFAAEWWNARKLLADSPEAEQEATTRAVAWLEEASALVAETKPLSIAEAPPITLRRLLLLYPLQSRTANVMRGAFYVCLCVLPVLLGRIITNLLTTDSPTEYLYGDVALISATAVLALGLRFLSAFVENENRTPTGENGRQVSLRRALLLYRFHGLAAQIVRLAFYISLLLSPIVAKALWETGGGSKYYRPGSAVQFLSYIGFVILLRGWAASLEATRKGNEANRVADLTTGIEQSRDQ
jgi:hypothetical protein